MQCYMCSTVAYVGVHTPCCFKPVCKLCAEDFKDTKCPCDNIEYRSSFHLVKFSSKRIRLGKLSYDFKTKKRQWKEWVNIAKNSIWKLPIPLDDYIKTFDKNVELYQENLDSVGSLQSAKLYVDTLQPFNYPMSEIDRVMPGRIIKNKKGENMVVSYQFIDFFEKNIDKPWNWHELSRNPILQ